jgi:hypothetical protein
MSSPAFSASAPLGNVTMSNVATVRDTPLTAGSTVFSGDAIAVGDNGNIRIALTDGAQAEILSGSVVRLAKEGDMVQMSVDRGQMSFRTSGNNKIEGLLPDATVRPADSKDVIAIIQTFGPKHAIVASEKGTLLITTLHDSRTITVREGEAADLSPAPPAASDPADPQGAPPIAAGKGTIIAASKATILIVGAVVAGGAAITAYALSKNNSTPSNTNNEISPAKLN